MTNSEFTRKYQTIENLLFRFAIKLTKSEAKAKDLLQDTALKAYSKRESFKGNQFKSWVSTIMYNTFINHYRAAKRRAKLVEHLQIKNLMAPKRESTNKGYLKLLEDDVQKQIEAVGPKSKAALSLHTKGYAYKEISDELNIPIGTVKSRINYAREKAKTKIIRMGLTQRYA